jgi:hypothetical protein
MGPQRPIRGHPAFHRKWSLLGAVLVVATTRRQGVRLAPIFAALG